MSEFTTNNQPGFQPRRLATERQIWWSGRGGQNRLATRQITIDASAVDAGSTPTTTLRAGLILAINANNGKAYAYDPDATDGTQNPVGVLERAVDMLVENVATDRFAQVLVSGMLRETELFGLDARARQLLASRFLFDRHLDEAAGGMLHPRSVLRKGSNNTVLASDTGSLFIATAAVAFTLPTAANGLAYRFLQTTDANLTIIGSGNLVHLGNAAANQVAFTTTSEKIGSHVLVECVYVAADTLKWVVTNLGGTTATLS